MTNSIRLVFMGSPDFAVPVLEALAERYPLAGVVTQPDRPAGRGNLLRPPAVKESALRLGIPIMQPEKLRLPEAMAQLEAWQPELIVVAAFGQILRPVVLDLPRLGCINVHASLLPRWRGAAPIQAAILAGDTKTGITIMKMDPGVDTGPILLQRSTPITVDETGGSLFRKLSALGAETLMEALPAYISGELQPHSQPAEGITHAPMLKKEDGHLDFTQPAEALARRVRAFHPWPGTFMDWKEAPLKVLQASAIRTKSPGAGHKLVLDGKPGVGCGEGILILEEVQPAAKKAMPGKAYLAGGREWGDANP